MPVTPCLLRPLDDCRGRAEFENGRLAAPFIAVLPGARWPQRPLTRSKPAALFRETQPAQSIADRPYLKLWCFFCILVLRQYYQYATLHVRLYFVCLLLCERVPLIWSAFSIHQDYFSWIQTPALLSYHVYCEDLAGNKKLPCFDEMDHRTDLQKS
jgi:hypothetical protein